MRYAMDGSSFINLVKRPVRSRMKGVVGTENSDPRLPDYMFIR